MWISRFWRRVVLLVERHKHFEALDEEMRLHMDLRAEALKERGTTLNEAPVAAKRQFGNRTALGEAAWGIWSFERLESVWRDLRFGARSLGHSAGFTSVVVLTLALGIGATTAMFSVIDNVLLEPFPYAHQQRLYSLVIHDQSGGDVGGRSLLPASEYLDYAEQNRVFEAVMGVAISRALWSRQESPESVNAPLVTPNAFEFLGVRALLGRIARPSDAEAGAPPVCVMSYSFWKSRFGADVHVLGKTLVLDGVARTVVGVMPPRFVFWSGDVWLPAQLRRDAASLGPPWFYLLGRLRKGVSVNAADRQINLVAERLARKYRPNLYPSRFHVELESFADSSIGQFRRTLFLLLAAVGLLLGIACANVASLMLAKMNGRRREFAIRSSLGAGWWRVVRQLFLESCLVAFGGTAAGCGVAWIGLKILVAILPQDTFPDEAVIGLNMRVLAATVVISAITALFFGLIPLLGGLRQDLNEAVKSGGRAYSGYRRSRFGNLLIVFEVAVSLVLLAAAGVTMRSFLREREVQLGFHVPHLLTAQVSLTKDNRSVQQQVRFIRDFTASMHSVPGVVEIAITSDVPPFGGAMTEFAFAGRTHSEQPDGMFAMISPNLFRTMGIPLLRGRTLTEADLQGKHMVAVVNQALADRIFGRGDAVGQTIEVTTLAHLPEPVRDPRVEIVGVVANAKNRGVRRPALPEAFLPYTVSELGGFSAIARTVGDSDTLGRTLERKVLSLDGSAVVRRTRTMEQALDQDEYAKPRFGLEMFAVFALSGILLVSTGLYSVMSYAVSQRRREMGIRMALGATASNVQTMVIRSGMRFVAVGIATGLALSFLSLRMMRSQVWGIAAEDPNTLIVAMMILVVVGVMACYLPSLSAARVDPAETLRSE